MNVLVTGATGFVGRALVLRLQRAGHAVTAWVRSPARAADQLGAGVRLVAAADGDLALRRAVRGADAVINLAGEPVLGGRWTAARRDRLIDSRVALTRRLVSAIASAPERPAVLVSASAVGFYGDRGDQWLDERSGAGADFLATLCDRWEQEALRAHGAGVRVATVRIGIVLGRDGGALRAMLPPFKLGLGGPLGGGRQYASWIHVEDLVEVLLLALEDDRVSGAVNATAPNPVTNRELSRALGAVLSRPAALPVPALALRALFGAGAATLLASQRVVPRALRELGFRFRFAHLDAALADLLGDDASVSIERSGGHYVLRQQTVIDAPLERVFDFFSRAENLGVMTPASVSFEILTDKPIAMGEGTRIDYRVRLGRVPLRWRTRITAWGPDRSFVDVQERGPYRSWHHLHRFTRIGHRTLMEDQVTYRPPLWLLGRIAHRLFIAGALRNIFAHRASAIRLRFGTADSTVARAA